MRVSLLSLIFLVSCGGDEFSEYYKLKTLRSLVVIADTPEINTASTVTLTPYVSHVDSDGSDLDITYEACIDPGVNFGADPDCNDADDLKLTGSYTFDMDALGESTSYTGAITPFTLTIDQRFFAVLATLDDKVQFNGLDIIVVIKIEDSDTGEDVEVLKRLKISSKTENLNQNPDLSNGVTASGDALTQYPDSKVKLSLTDDDLFEEFEFYNADGDLKTIDERPLLSWYTTKGSLNLSQVDPDDTVTFRPKDDGVLVVVVRDGRYGAAISIFN